MHIKFLKTIFQQYVISFDNNFWYKYKVYIEYRISKYRIEINMILRETQFNTQ